MISDYLQTKNPLKSTRYSLDQQMQVAENEYWKFDRWLKRKAVFVAQQRWI
jgi:hypothetical protein